VNAVTEAQHRLQRFNEQIEVFVKEWRLYPVVEALMSMRGVKMIVAVTVVSELGDLSRFDNPKQLMSFLGLTPSELQLRQARIPLVIRDIAWRAQLRLTQRYQHIQRKGKPHNVTVVALARELAGFMWAIANEVMYPR